MRPDRFSLAKAWINDERSTPEEAKATWDAMGKEFDENRKATLMANAETDKIKAMMNEKYGPGTIKYGSEIKQPEIKTPQAIFEFSQRNPAAKGGRMGFAGGRGTFKSGESFKTVKEFKNVSGPGTGLGYENPANIKKAKIALNKIKKQRNKKLFFDYKEGDEFWNKLTQEVDLSRENLSKLIKNTIAQEFPGAYVGKEGRKQHRIDTVVKSFLSHYDHNGSFDGNEKFAKILEQFHGSADHKYESINNTFKDWVKGYGTSNQGNKVPVEVEGVDRANLDQDLLKDLKKWKPNSKPQKNLMVQSELKFLNDLNSKGTYRNAPLNYERVQQLYRDFMKKEFPDIENVDNRFFHRLNQLTELKQTGSYSTGNGNYSKIPGITGDKNRADWLKKGFGIQFQGNYSKIILKADKLLAEGNKAEANRLYKAADKFFGPDGIFTKAEGEGEHPFSRKWGRGKIGNELKINSLVKSDLNQFKRANFDVPVTQLFNEYKVADPKRQKEIAMEIEDRKKLMNYLTEGPNTKGIVEPVKFNYGKTSIGASVDVPDIDKIKNFDVQEFITRGEDYRGSFLTQGEEFNLVDKNKNIISSKIPDEEFRKMIKVIGCPNFKAAGGGRAEFSEGGDCFDKGTKLINSGMKGASPAALKNLAKLGPMLLKAGSAVMSGLIVPEALIVGLESAARVGLGDTPSEAILRATDYLTPDSFFGDFLQKADLMKLERTLGKDVANIAAQSFDRTNQSDKVNKLEEKLKNLEAMTESGDFGYVGDLTNQINMTKDQIKQEKNKLKNITQTGQESKDIFTERALEDSYDASMAKSKFAASQLVNSQSENPRISAEQAMQDMKSQEQLNKKQLPQRMLKGSAGEQAFLNLSQLPKGPRQGSEIDDLVTASNANFKSMGSDRRVDSSLLKYIQDLKQKEKDMSIADMVNVYGAESILGTQGNMGQPVERTGPGYMTNYKPLNRFGSQQRPVLYPKGRGQLAEGGITGLRSKYEYKK